MLEAAGLIETRREGRSKFHDLDTGPFEHIADRWVALDDRLSGGPQRDTCIGGAARDRATTCEVRRSL